MASDSNPYKLSYVAIAKAPQMAQNPLAIFLNTYGPASKDPVFSQVDERVLLDRFTAAAVSGAIPPAVAAQAITQFYNFGISYQADKTKYALFGLGKQTNYNVKIPTEGFFGSLLHGYKGSTSGDGLDLTNTPAVEAYITKQAAVKKLEEQINSGARTDLLGNTAAGGIAP